MFNVMWSKVKVRQGRPYGNVVNLIVSEQLNGYKQKLTKYLLYLGDKLFRFLRSWGQRSRSETAINIANYIDPEPLKGFETEPKHIHTPVGILTL